MYRTWLAARLGIEKDLLKEPSLRAALDEALDVALLRVPKLQVCPTHPCNLLSLRSSFS